MQRMTRRRGVAAVLAMLYLVLFGILALGFYAATTTAVQVVHNDAKITQASLAAESGLQFMTYQLSQVRVTQGIAESEVFADLANQLSAILNQTSNMEPREVGYSGSMISIPAGINEYIALPDNNGSFRATIRRDGQQIVLKVIGRSADAQIARAIELNYDRDYRDGLFDFAVASKGKITTSGSSHVIGSPNRQLANFLSAAKNEAYPIVISGKEIGGDVSIVSRIADVDYQKGSVGGTSNEQEIRAHHIKKGVPEPEFPVIDTELYRNYAVNQWPTYVSEAAPAHLGNGETFAWSGWVQETLWHGRHSGQVLLGGGSLADVIALRATEAWLESVMRNSPRLLLGQLRGDWVDLLAAEMAGQAFDGLAAPGGFIVLAKNDKGGDNGGGNSGGNAGNDNGGGNGHVYRNCYVPAGSNPNFTGKDIIEGVLYIEPGNMVKFAGGVQIRGIIVVGKDPNMDVEDTVLDFRGTVDAYGVETLDPEVFGDLTQQTGLFIAAEGAEVDFRGNFNTVVTGSIIASKISFNGSAGGSIRGSIIGMDPRYPMEISNAQSSDLVFLSRARENPPTGVHFTSYFTPVSSTYREVQP